jgi:hypothetical protein
MNAAGHATASLFQLRRRLPGLTHEVVAEAAMRLLFDAHEALRLVEAARCDEDAVGPRDSVR